MHKPKPIYAQRLVLVNEDGSLLRILGYISEDFGSYFIFRSGSGKEYEISRKSNYQLQTTQTVFRDLSSPYTW